MHMTSLNRSAFAFILTARRLRSGLWDWPSQSGVAHLGGRAYGIMPETAGTPINQLTDRLNLLLKEHQYRDVLTVFDASERKDFVQTAILQNSKNVAHVYDSALLACAQLADWEKARKLVKTMWYKRIPVGRVAQACVIKAYCAAGRHSKALTYIKSIPSTRMTIVHANILLSSCASARDTETGLRCWELVQKRKLSPDAATWCDLLRLLGIAHNKSGVDETWLQAKDAIGSDSGALSMVWTAYISALAYCGDVQGAAANCNLFMEHFSTDLGLLVTENHQSEQGHSKRAIMVRRESSSPGEHLLVACNTTLHAAADHGEYRLMRRLVRSMNLTGLTPDAVTYNALLKANSHQGGLQAVQEGMEEMERLGLSLTSSTYAVLMRVAGAEGLPHVAQEGMNTMLLRGVEPEPSAWAALIQAYAGIGDLDGVYDAYKQAIARIGRQAQWSVHASCFASLSLAISKVMASGTGSVAYVGGEVGGQESSSPDAKQRGSEIIGIVEADARASVSLSSPTVLAAAIEAYGMLGDVSSVVRLLGMQEYLESKAEEKKSGSDRAHLEELLTFMKRLPALSTSPNVPGLWTTGCSALIRADRFDMLLDCLDHISHNKGNMKGLSAAPLYVAMIDACTMPPRPSLARALLDQMMLLIPMTDEKMNRILAEAWNAYVKVVMAIGGLEAGLAVLEDFGPGMKANVRSIAFSALKSRAVKNSRTDVTEKIKEFFPEQLFEDGDGIHNGKGNAGWQGYYASDEDDDWN